MATLIFFYIFSVLAVLGALALIFARSPIYCALGLVETLIALAGIYILLEYEFVAAMQILIYAGAIMILFLFVIMLLNLREFEQSYPRWSFSSLAGITLAVLLLSQLLSLIFDPAASSPQPEASATATTTGTGPAESTLSQIGERLLTSYVLPFEVVSIVLMIAVIGAVLLARRQFPYTGPKEESQP